MSASPEPHPTRPDDEIVTLLSAWLAYHATNVELHRGLLAIGLAGLRAEQADAVSELLDELAQTQQNTRGDLEMLVRETLEAVALG
jgi:hypothetical protein